MGSFTYSYTKNSITYNLSGLTIGHIYRLFLRFDPHDGVMIYDGKEITESNLHGIEKSHVYQSFHF